VKIIAFFQAKDFVLRKWNSSQRSQKNTYSLMSSGTCLKPHVARNIHKFSIAQTQMYFLCFCFSLFFFAHLWVPKESRGVCHFAFSMICCLALLWC